MKKYICLIFLIFSTYGDIFTMEQTDNIFLSSSKAIQDLERFQYYIEKGAIAYYESDKHAKQIFCSKINTYKKQLTNLEKISIPDFYNELTKIIGTSFLDNHSYLYLTFSDKKYLYRFAPQHEIYFSKELFSKSNNAFFSDAYKSKITNISILNSNYFELNKPFFVPIIKNNKTFYKIIYFSNSKDVNIDCYLNDTCKISLIQYKSDYINRENYNRIYNNERSSFWACPFFDYEQPIRDIYINAYIESAKQSTNKDIIFIDNRGNPGGIPFYHIKLLFYLFGLDLKCFNDYVNKKNLQEGNIEGSALLSKIIAEKNLNIQQTTSDNNNSERKFWKEIFTKYSTDDLKFYNDNTVAPWLHNTEITKKIKFHGLIVFIMDNTTASWGELFYDYIVSGFNYKNVILIGTSSKGCVLYGNPLLYQLENSNIQLVLSSRVDNEINSSVFYKNNIEGKGFFPEYWITSEEDLTELLDYLYKKATQK